MSTDFWAAAPAEIRNLASDLMRSIQRSDNNRAADAAKADPTANKLSRVFDGKMRWRYYRTKNRRGQTVSFAWSTTRNIAGYFLGWREVVTKSGSGKRDQWTASRRRATVTAIALRRYTAARATLTKEAA